MILLVFDLYKEILIRQDIHDFAGLTALFFSNPVNPEHPVNCILMSS